MIQIYLLTCLLAGSKIGAIMNRLTSAEKTQVIAVLVERKSVRDAVVIASALENTIQRWEAGYAGNAWPLKK
jgi:hypothetical protein